MNLAKVLGAVLLLFTGGSVYLFFDGKERKKAAALDAWIGLFEYVKQEISLRLSPLNEVFETADLSAFSKFGGVEKSFVGLLRLTAPCLNFSTSRFLSSRLNAFGKGSAEEQVALCDFLLTRLEQEKENFKKEYPAKQKGILVCSVCGALGLSVLLW